MVSASDVKSGFLGFFKKRDNVMAALIVLAFVSSIAASAALRPFNLGAATIYYLSTPGRLFMNVLKLLILPLMTMSLLTGLFSLNLKSSGRLGGYTIFYYVITTFIAGVLGIILVSIIRPGNPSVISEINKNSTNNISNIYQPSLGEAICNILENIFPNNLIRLTMQQTDIKLRTNKETGKFTIETGYSDVPNFLGLIFFIVFFGIVIASMGKKSQPLKDIIFLVNDATMLMIKACLNLLPLGIFFLILNNLLSSNDIGETLKVLGLYALTVIVGLIIHGFIILPLLYLVIVRKNPYSYILNMSEAMITAFLIQSSSATLPATLKCCEEKNGIHPVISRFMLPIGAVCNMDGTGLYEAIAAIFIAQINGIELGIVRLATISLTATLAAIGAATIPSAGLMTLLIVLTTAGLPTHQVSLLYSIDWFLDRCRTTINVLGDAIGCGIVQHLCKQQVVDTEENNQSDDQPNIELKNVCEDKC